MTTEGFTSLRAKFEDKSAHIGIIGMGYVGLPLARAFCDAGYTVSGFDLDEDRVAQLNRGESPFRHISDESVKRHVSDGVFEATTDFKRIRRMEVAIVCVPTPLTPARDPDLSYVRDSVTKIRTYMNSGMLVVLESTTYPGTTAEVVRPILEDSGLYCGEDFFLAYSPEREDPGNENYGTHSIPKLVGGVDEKSGELAELLYSQVVKKVVQVKDCKTAEAAKVLENIYRAVNIALVNELKVLFEPMDINVWDVIAAASTKPFGYQAFYPGPGLGGHCIPIDPFYLAWRAREYDMPTRFIELAGEINTAMPEYVVSRVTDALNREGKALMGSNILVLGVAYKRDVEDTRESPALKLLSMLADKGAEVSYHDPHVETLRLSKQPRWEIESTALSADGLAGTDLVLIVTDHTEVDYDLVLEHSNIVVDTRNVYGKHQDTQGKVVRA